MSGGFAQDDGFFQGGYGGDQQQGYDMGYGQQQNDFGSFDYSSQQQSQGGYSNYEQPPSFGQHTPYTGNILTPDQHAYSQPSSNDEEDYENEPPLLEELGKTNLYYNLCFNQLL